MENSLKILVIHGGDSSEREVSLKSSENICRALKNAGFTVYVYDPRDNGDITVALQGIDVVFPIIHGKGGEDGTLQLQLEVLGIPYVGSSSSVSRVCFDKWQTMQHLPSTTFPESELVTEKTITTSKLTKMPFVIKPISEGSSVDTFIIRDVSFFDASKLDNIFSKYGQLLLQELIDGVELTVPVVNGIALPVIEIIPPHGEEFDYENKYNGKTSELCPPEHLPVETQQQAQQIALMVHNSLGCSGFSRTDFIYKEQQLYMLEINTLPGMTKQSLLPKSASVAGITIERLVSDLVHDALQK